MAKKSGSRLAALISRNFPISSWLDVNRLKGFMRYIVGLFNRLFILKPQAAEESFDEAKKRLKMTDKALLARQTALFRVSLLMLFFAGLLFCYMVYQMLYGSVLGVGLSLIVMTIALSLFFRYHFWYFQLKTKQLGCSWKIWLSEGLLGGKKS